MIKKINKYINLSITTSILFILLGLVILFFPKTMLDIFSYSVSTIAIITGIYLLILEIKTRNTLFQVDSALNGVLILVLGLVIIIHPNAFQTLIPLALGIWFITSSVIKFKVTSILKNENFGIWFFSLLLTILSIICGLIFILNPMESSKIVAIYFGIIIIVYSISDICEMMIVKININKIGRFLKESIRIID